jgi:hypothetical protein
MQEQQQVMEPQLQRLCSAQLHLLCASTHQLRNLGLQDTPASRLPNHLHLQYSNSKASCPNHHHLQDSCVHSCSCVLLHFLELDRLLPLGPCCPSNSSSCSSNSDSQTFLQQGVARQGWGHRRGQYCHTQV